MGAQVRTRWRISEPKWTMWSPAKQKAKLEGTLDTPKPQNRQYAVALSLAKWKGQPPVQVLKPLPEGTDIKLPARVFVVACRWPGAICEQFVASGTIESVGSSPQSVLKNFRIALAETYDVNLLAGGAVLDEEGRVIAVLTGWTTASPTSVSSRVDADDIRTVLLR
jgi:hypothetical protein